MRWKLAMIAGGVDLGLNWLACHSPFLLPWINSTRGQCIAWHMLHVPSTWLMVWLRGRYTGLVVVQTMLLAWLIGWWLERRRHT